MACAESVAKSKKALNHQGTKEAFFVCRACPEKTLCLRVFVVPFFSGPCATPSFARVTTGNVNFSCLRLSN